MTLARLPADDDDVEHEVTENADGEEAQRPG